MSRQNLAASSSYFTDTAPRGGMNRRFILGALASGLAVGGGWSVIKPALALVPHFDAGVLTNTQAPAPVQTAPQVPAGNLDHASIVPSPMELRDWAAFRARCITAEGRVVDNFNGGVSHTESQGLGMLFAVAFNDRDTFDRIWNWTSATLARPGDALHAWRYDPRSAVPVADMNNATDGDIYIAAALVRGGARWQAPAYLQAGQAIARDMLDLLLTQVGGRTLLLPGAFGFSFSDHVVVNLSYYVFPLLADLRTAYPSPVWDGVFADGQKLVAEAQFGSHRLPPDWLTVSAQDGSLSLCQDRPRRFAYDAVRVPLFAAWSDATPDALAPAANFWGHNPAAAPAWIDLDTDEASPWRLSGGMVAIAKLVGRQAGRFTAVHLPASAAHEGYYSGALQLLTRVAMREIDWRANAVRNG